MTRLVEDLLDISRITMGKATLDREVLDLAALARGVVQTFKQTGRPGASAIQLEAAQVWVDADRARLEQVLTNLLDNALKFSPALSPVTVSVRQDGGQAVLTVADAGVGIEGGAIGRIFDLFVQGEQGPDRSKGGLGIGLALVKRVVELHGGAVAAASEGIGKGAVFSVRLPAAGRPVEAQAPAAAPRAAGARNILIIEDNDDARQMLGAVLSLSGHTVREARDGASGLERAAAETPEVALIDIGLPDLDGYEVARRLRSGRGGRAMKLIAITGYGQPEDERRALEAGFDAHLTKPVAADVLKQMLASMPVSMPTYAP
jgi:CheY-like chemotaxis protein